VTAASAAAAAATVKTSFATNPVKSSKAPIQQQNLESEYLRSAWSTPFERRYSPFYPNGGSNDVVDGGAGARFSSAANISAYRRQPLVPPGTADCITLPTDGSGDIRVPRRSETDGAKRDESDVQQGTDDCGPGCSCNVDFSCSDSDDGELPDLEYNDNSGVEQRVDTASSNAATMETASLTSVDDDATAIVTSTTDEVIKEKEEKEKEEEEVTSTTLSMPDL